MRGMEIRLIGISYCKKFLRGFLPWQNFVLNQTEMERKKKREKKLGKPEKKKSASGAIMFPRTNTFLFRDISDKGIIK